MFINSKPTSPDAGAWSPFKNNDQKNGVPETRTKIMAAMTTTSATGNGNTNGANYRGAFAIMTSLFFLWDFMTVLNDIHVNRLPNLAMA